MDEFQVKYSAYIQSAIVILTWYLDEKKGLLISLSNQFNTIDTLSGMSDKVSHQKEQHLSDWIMSKDVDLFSNLNATVLTSLKNLRLLQSDFKLLLSLSDLQDLDVCKSYAVKYADLRVMEIISTIKTKNDEAQSRENITNSSNKSNDNIPVHDSNDANNSFSHDQLITVTNKKLCVILNVSVIYFNHRMLKTLFKLNEKVILTH
jgi:hypothetical protein